MTVQATLDKATDRMRATWGSGDYAKIAAARRFCDATGVDYVPALVEAARRRAEAEGLAIDFRTADAEALPFDDSSFDYVLSAIGVMFTADHTRAARELTRVCRPGGTIGTLSWTPDGFVGEMLKIVGDYVAPPAGSQPAPRWAPRTTCASCSASASQRSGGAPAERRMEQPSRTGST